MLTDFRDVPTSAASQAAIGGYEGALKLLAGFYLDPLAAIDATLAEHPDFVMGHIFRGALFVTAMEKAVAPMLADTVATLGRLGTGANDRERAHIAALRAMNEGDFARGADIYTRIADEHPRDLLALVVGHQMNFFLGRTAELRDAPARALPAWDASAPGRGYLYGMQAFGLEENHSYAAAEEAGRRALDLEPCDPWAVHAVAHVMEMQGRTAEGIAWLSGREHHWAPDNMLAYHNWWHRALFHLDRGETGAVLAIYDAHIAPKPEATALEMVDASAMLWRLHLRGLSVGDRWEAVADHWAPRAEDAYYAFNDVHAAMATVGAGRDGAARHIALLERRAGGNGTNAELTRDIGLPVARAIYAFGEGRYAEAARTLAEVRPIAHRSGGSNAQRDILSLTALEAACRAGDARLAGAFAAERIAARPESPFNRSALARAEALLATA